MDRLYIINKKILIELLKEHNMAELARRAGISKNTFYKMTNATEKTTQMNAITAYKLAQAMGMHTDSFIKLIYELD